MWGINSPKQEIDAQTKDNEVKNPARQFDYVNLKSAQEKMNSEVGMAKDAISRIKKTLKLGYPLDGLIALDVINTRNIDQLELTRKQRAYVFRLSKKESIPLVVISDSNDFMRRIYSSNADVYHVHHVREFKEFCYNANSSLKKAFTNRGGERVILVICGITKTVSVELKKAFKQDQLIKNVIEGDPETVFERLKEYGIYEIHLETEEDDSDEIFEPNNSRFSNFTSQIISSMGNKPEPEVEIDDDPTETINTIKSEYEEIIAKLQNELAEALAKNSESNNTAYDGTKVLELKELFKAEKEKLKKEYDAKLSEERSKRFDLEEKLDIATKKIDEISVGLDIAVVEKTEKYGIALEESYKTVQELEEKLANLEAKLRNEHAIALTRSEQTIQELSNKVDELSGELLKYTDAIKEMSQVNDEQYSELVATKTELAKVQSKLSDADLDKMEAVLELTKELDAVKAEVETGNSKFNDAVIQLANMRSEKNKISAELSKIYSEKSEISAKLIDYDSLKTKYDSLELKSTSTFVLNEELKQKLEKAEALVVKYKNDCDRLAESVMSTDSAEVRDEVVSGVLLYFKISDIPDRFLSAVRYLSLITGYKVYFYGGGLLKTKLSKIFTEVNETDMAAMYEIKTSDGVIILDFARDFNSNVFTSINMQKFAVYVKNIGDVPKDWGIINGESTEIVDLSFDEKFVRIATESVRQKLYKKRWKILNQEGL